MPNFDNISFEAGLPAARITLNRPAKRNALNAAMIHEITESLAECAKDEKVRVVVLSGAGADFCSGADLQALESNREASVLQMMGDAGATAELFLRMRQHPKPIIAAVQGRALAGGCGLAMAADLVLAAQSAQFGYPEINVGFIPAMVTALLRRAVSEKNVFELVTTGEIIPATRARELGLINRVFPDQDFQREVDTYAAALSRETDSNADAGEKTGLPHGWDELCNRRGSGPVPERARPEDRRLRGWRETLSVEKHRPGTMTGYQRGLTRSCICRPRSWRSDFWHSIGATMGGARWFPPPAGPRSASSSSQPKGAPLMFTHRRTFLRGASSPEQPVC